MGIAGVAGEGQGALFAALSGEIRARRARNIQIDGQPIGALPPKARRKLASSGRRNLRTRTKKIRSEYDVRAASGDPKAGTLSGGNLQKFVIGRELDREPSVFVVAQPTWGVDAGAASFIRNALLDLTQRGSAVVLISQDLDEIFQIADRVAVLHRGELSETYPIDDMSPDKIGLLMAGADISDYTPLPANSAPAASGIKPKPQLSSSAQPKLAPASSQKAAVKSP